MLSQWLNRGLGQIVAPDNNFVEETKNDSFWQMVAPDPNYDAKKQSQQQQAPPPSSAFLSPVRQVLCKYCNKMTPVVDVSVAKTPDTNQRLRQIGRDYNNDNMMMTPEQQCSRTTSTTTEHLNNTNDNAENKQSEFVHQMVLKAATDTAQSMTLPSNAMEHRNKCFRICASAKPITEKLQKKLRKMVQSDPLLLNSRATHLGNLVPKGYTPLMAAAYSNQDSAVEILLQVEKEHHQQQQQQQSSSVIPIHLHRDLEGKTALHIAAEHGHLSIINLLLPLYDIPYDASRGNAAAAADNSINDTVEQQDHSEAKAAPTATAETTQQKQPQPQPQQTPDTSNKTNDKGKMQMQTPQPTVLSPPPIDLLGRTPLGSAMTSPNPKAKQNQKQLEKTLFSPVDVSVIGNFVPMKNRYFYSNYNNVMYGNSEMPGFRIHMEDTIMCHNTYLPLLSSSSCCSSSQMEDQNKGQQKVEQEQQEYCCLLGVLDGHSDNREISQCIADHIPDLLQGQIKEYNSNDNNKNENNTHDDATYWKAIWDKTCLDMDLQIKKEIATAQNNRGGSTAIFTLITSTSIIVANVGDCRCILVEYEQKSQEQQQQQQQDENKSTTINSSNLGSSVSVLALSQDHKPNLEEEQNRIEKAGMKVVPVSFKQEQKSNEKAETTTIYKIRKSEKDQMAVSRSFGDFDYKDNITLSETRQAVIPTPDITIHTRDNNRDEKSKNRKHSFLVLASDGIWDVMSNEDVAEFIMNEMNDKLHIFDSSSKKSENDTEATTSISNSTDNKISTITEENEQSNTAPYNNDNRNGNSAFLLPQIADSLLLECLRKRGARDNMSVIIAALDETAQIIFEYQQKLQTGTENDDDYTSSLLLQGKALNFNSPRNAI